MVQQHVVGFSDWHGPFREGTGTISTQNGTLKGVSYTYASRFERAPGACPEELLAAAHAACFNHALANIMGGHEVTPGRIDTSAELAMGPDERGYPSILGVHFTVRAQAAGVSVEQLQHFAEMAKTGCAISKALRVPLTIQATLDQ